MAHFMVCFEYGFLKQDIMPAWLMLLFLCVMMLEDRWLFPHESPQHPEVSAAFLKVNSVGVLGAPWRQPRRYAPSISIAVAFENASEASDD